MVKRTNRPSFPAHIDFSSRRPEVAKPVAPLKPGLVLQNKVPASVPGTRASALALEGAMLPQEKRENQAPALGGFLQLGTAPRTPEHSALRARMVQRLQVQAKLSPKVLAIMNAVERHCFIDAALLSQAYEDMSIPIGLEQTISRPSIVARMLDLLLEAKIVHKAKDGSPMLGRVLEIGTGCGYQASALSLLASEVYSIERLRSLHEKARTNVRQFRIPNLHLLLGDGILGYPKGAPYAAIIAAAGGDAVPQAWCDQLAEGGRLVAPMVTQAGKQALVVIDKTAQGLQKHILESVHFVPLKSGIA